MAETGYKSSSHKQNKNGGQKKSSALGRFMSFIRRKDKEPVVQKRGITSRQKSTDSGISSNRDTYINSDENGSEGRNHSYDHNRSSRHSHCSSIKVVRNNSQIHHNSIGKINNNAYSTNTKRTHSTLGGRGKRPNNIIKRSNTSIGQGNNTSTSFNRLSKNNMGHTSDSSTSSTGYMSDHRNNPRHTYNSRDRDTTTSGRYYGSKDRDRDYNTSKSSSPKKNNVIVNNRRRGKNSSDESSSDSYSSSDNSSYSSDEVSLKRSTDKKSKNSHSKTQKHHYSDEDETSNKLADRDGNYRDELQEDKDKKQENPAQQLEAIPEGSEEEERCNQRDNYKLQDKHITKQLTQIQANRDRAINLASKRAESSRSYHGPLDEASDDNEECLFKEAQKEKALPKGRSMSTDASLNTDTSRLNWRKPRKSYGDNQFSKTPPRTFEKDLPCGVKAVCGVKALVSKLQTKSEVNEEPDPFLAAKFEQAKKLGRGSKDGLDDFDACDDDPLFVPKEPAPTRRAGLSQGREGRALMSRKNSFNSSKIAVQSGRMSADDRTDRQSRDLDERPKGASVQRSTSRVKQIAMSLHERETTVRKTEAMIANHQPLAEDSDHTNKTSDIQSNGHPSPLHRRANSKPTGKTDDSFIKELLEIARAESQEKQKTDITFTPKSLMTNNYRSMSLDKRLSDRSNSKQYTCINETDELDIISDDASTNKSKTDDKASKSVDLDSNNSKLSVSKPKDFKEAISMASTRFARKKNSMDSNNNLEKDDENETNSHDDLLEDTDNLIHEIRDSPTNNNSPTNTNSNIQRKNRMIDKPDLPYSTVPGRRRSRLSSQEAILGGSSNSRDNHISKPRGSVGQKARMFEQADQREKSYKEYQNQLNSHHHAPSHSTLNHSSHNHSTHSSNHKQFPFNSNKSPVVNQCSSSSGIYSGNPDEDDAGQESRYPDLTENVRNHRQYYDNLINKVRSLNRIKYSPTKLNNPDNGSLDNLDDVTVDSSRGHSPVRQSPWSSRNALGDEVDPTKVKTRVVKKKKIIRKIRSSVDKDSTNSTEKIVTRVRGKSTL